MVTDGSSFSVVPGEAHVRGRSSGVQPRKRSDCRPAKVLGRWRRFKGARRNSQGPKPWMSPDVARKIAQSSVARLDKALEALGDVAGAAVEVLKAKLTKGKAACGGCGTQSVSQVHGLRRIRELDTQSAEECVLKTEGPGAS